MLDMLEACIVSYYYLIFNAFCIVFPQTNIWSMKLVINNGCNKRKPQAILMFNGPKSKRASEKFLVWKLQRGDKFLLQYIYSNIAVISDLF